MFKKILVADRSENALNIIRSCRELGIESVAVFSDVDFNALHIVLADYCCHLKGKDVASTYGNAEAIIKLAKEQGCDAIYPGNRFFNLDAGFARLVSENGLSLIGASATDVEKISDYSALLSKASAAGLKTLEHSKPQIVNPADVFPALENIGYPALIRFDKHYRCIEIVKQSEDVDEVLHRIAKSGCTGDCVLVQKYIPHTNVIAAKLLADKMGNCLVLHDLDASLQISGKQLIVQGPILKLSNEVKAAIREQSVQLVKALQISGVITVEFVVSGNDVYFWDLELILTECSTLTELITGVNLFEYQFRLAAGESIKLQQEDINYQNYAIASFIRAEDPLVGFNPSINKINRYLPSIGYGICLESAAYEGYLPPMEFGTSIGRLYGWGKNRDEAINRIKRGLQEFIITGPRTNIPFFLFLMEHPQFTENQFHANFVEEEFSRLKLRQFYVAESKSIELERAAVTAALSYYLKAEEINLKSTNKDSGNWKKYHRFWETAYKD